MILYINCCCRKESRTNRLAKKLLETLGEYEQLDLYDLDLKPLNEERLKLRDSLLEKKAYTHEMFQYARQFAAADIIVVAAPYWDLSFPSLLKVYIENIYVQGIVSCFKEGKVVGLCKAKKLYYVTTSGGPYDPRFSYAYMETLCKDYFGICETECMVKENLDI